MIESSSLDHELVSLVIDARPKFAWGDVTTAEGSPMGLELCSPISCVMYRCTCGGFGSNAEKSSVQN